MDKVVKKHYNDSILEEACSNYGIDFSTSTLLKGNANLIFDCGNKILRLSHSSIRNKNEIVSEIDWLLFLRKQGLPVVKILKSKQKQYLTIIGNDEQHFSCVCFEKIEGEQIPTQDWNTVHYEKLGRLTGKLHKIGQNYIENPAITYKHWNEIPEYDCYGYLPKDSRNLLQLHNLLVDEFFRYPQSKLTYGLIHYDIHHGNYLRVGDEKKLVLFDFEMICKSWYVNDIASIVHYASHHPANKAIKEFDSLFLIGFWKGYEKEYHLEQAEKAKIPKFVLYRDLMVYGFLHKICPTNQSRKPLQHYFDRLSNSIEKRRKNLGI